LDFVAVISSFEFEFIIMVHAGDGPLIYLAGFVRIKCRRPTFFSSSVILNWHADSRRG
jgi:hypothetical protein